MFARQALPYLHSPWLVDPAEPSPVQVRAPQAEAHTAHADHNTHTVVHQASGQVLQVQGRSTNGDRTPQAVGADIPHTRLAVQRAVGEVQRQRASRNQHTWDEAVRERGRAGEEAGVGHVRSAGAQRGEVAEARVGEAGQSVVEVHGGDALHAAGDGADTLHMRVHRILARMRVRAVVVLVAAVVGPLAPELQVVAEAVERSQDRLPTAARQVEVEARPLTRAKAEEAGAEPLSRASGRGCRPSRLPRRHPTHCCHYRRRAGR